MSTIRFDSPISFIDTAIREKTENKPKAIGGMVPMMVAQEILEVKGTRLRHLIANGKLREIEICIGEKSYRGIQLESLMNCYTERLERSAKLQAADEESVEKLIKFALTKKGFVKTKACLTYADDLMVPLGLDHHFSRDRDHIGKICGAISMASLNNPKCGAMLSAVIVNKSGKDKGRPSESFFRFAEDLTGNKFHNKNDMEKFWQEQISLLQNWLSTCTSS